MRSVPLCLCLCVIVASTSCPAATGALAPARASQIVTLSQSNDCPSFAGAARIGTIIRPDGTSEPFTIPPKRVLVITGMLAAQNGQGGPIAGHTVAIGLLLGAYNLVFQTVVADASNAFTVQATFPTGIVVAPGPDLCIIAQDLTNGLRPIQIGLAVQIDGFVAKDK